MLRKIFKGIIAVLLIGALGFVTYLRATEKPAETTSIEDIERSEGKAVSVVNPEAKTFDDYIYADATLRAPGRYVMRASISELVERVKVDVGDTVEPGDLLVEFRKDDIQSDIDAAKTRFEEAEKNYERFSNLLERGVVSEDAVEARLTAKQEARAALHQLRSRLGFTEVRAPSKEKMDYEDGNIQVSARNVDPGEFSPAGQPLITLSDMSVIEVEAFVPERGVGYLSYGQALEFRLEHEREWRKADMVRISPGTEHEHRFFSVYARTRNSKIGGLWRLRPGMYAEVRISKRGGRSSMALPASVLRIGQDGCCSVFFVEPERHGDGNERYVARKTEIETGLRRQDWVEVLSPELEGHELAIRNPRQDLNDGDPVRVE